MGCSVTITNIEQRYEMEIYNYNSWKTIKRVQVEKYGLMIHKIHLPYLYSIYLTISPWYLLKPGPSQYNPNEWGLKQVTYLYHRIHFKYSTWGKPWWFGYLKNGIWESRIVRRKYADQKNPTDLCLTYCGLMMSYFIIEQVTICHLFSTKPSEEPISV